MFRNGDEDVHSFNVSMVHALDGHVAKKNEEERYIDSTDSSFPGRIR